MPKLSALRVEQISELGMYGDGQGLYLCVDRSGKRWVYRYIDPITGKRKKLSLYPYHKSKNSLADAREAAAEARKLVRLGLDPSLERRRERDEQARLESERRIEREREELTFEAVAVEWHTQNKGGWANQKHVDQVINTLRDYAFPVFGSVPVYEVSIEDVISCLKPIWHTKTETAKRVRQRIERVLSYAKTMGYRSSSNPALWKSNLDQVFPCPSKLKLMQRLKSGKDGHHPALSYQELPDFWENLVKREGSAALALRLCILTATRTYSVRHARWVEIDLEKKVWTIPPLHKKGFIQFRVALSDEAVSLLSCLPKLGEFIFPGGKEGNPLSENGMLSLIARMGLKGQVTTHGFRSTFRDYIGEKTNLDTIVAEHCLAHKVGDATERAYARGDMLEKRFHMMNIWADYVTSKLTHGSTRT